MQTLTSRDVQVRYGEFVESVQDDVVCVTRHGRPLYWALSDSHLRAQDPSVFIGRMLRLRGQIEHERAQRTATPLPTFSDALKQLDGSIEPSGLSEADVMQIVHENRR
jgi:hypothetical protein